MPVGGDDPLSVIGHLDSDKPIERPTPQVGLCLLGVMVPKMTNYLLGTDRKEVRGLS